MLACWPIVCLGSADWSRLPRRHSPWHVFWFCAVLGFLRQVMRRLMFLLQYVPSRVPSFGSDGVYALAFALIQ